MAVLWYISLVGKLSDYLISRSDGKGGNVGKRVQVVMMYTVGIALALCSFQVRGRTSRRTVWPVIWLPKCVWRGWIMC